MSHRLFQRYHMTEPFTKNEDVDENIFNFYFHFLQKISCHHHHDQHWSSRVQWRLFNSCRLHPSLDLKILCFPLLLQDIFLNLCLRSLPWPHRSASDTFHSWTNASGLKLSNATHFYFLVNIGIWP